MERAHFLRISPLECCKHKLGIRSCSELCLSPWDRRWWWWRRSYPPDTRTHCCWNRKFRLPLEGEKCVRGNVFGDCVMRQQAKKHSWSLWDGRTPPGWTVCPGNMFAERLAAGIWRETQSRAGSAPKQHLCPRKNSMWKWTPPWGMETKVALGPKRGSLLFLSLQRNIRERREACLKNIQDFKMLMMMVFKYHHYCASGSWHCHRNWKEIIGLSALRNLQILIQNRECCVHMLHRFFCQDIALFLDIWDSDRIPRAWRCQTGSNRW